MVYGALPMEVKDRPRSPVPDRLPLRLPLHSAEAWSQDAITCARSNDADVVMFSGFK